MEPDMTQQINEIARLTNELSIKLSRNTAAAFLEAKCTSISALIRLVFEDISSGGLLTDRIEKREDELMLALWNLLHDSLQRVDELKTAKDTGDDPVEEERDDYIIMEDEVEPIGTTEVTVIIRKGGDQ